MRHFHALFVKRVHNFKRDLKGLCFLIFIPIIVTLGAIILIKASCTVSDFQQAGAYVSFHTTFTHAQQLYVMPSRNTLRLVRLAAAEMS
jgi:hypothetical protein